MSELFSLHGRVALITGATRGIGYAIALEYGRAGARLAISGETAEECQAAVSALALEGFEVAGFPADLSDHHAVHSLSCAVLKHYGQVDVLVCNAGVAPHMGPIATASDKDWELTLSVNLRSALWLTSALLPGMAEIGGGSVIFMASIAGVRGNKGLGLYGLSKAGLAQLARNLAVEWGPSNIRVNAISPGVIQTDFARSLTDNLEIMKRRLALTPLRRVGCPEEVAAIALLLAAPGGAFISGQNIIVDGGTTIGDGN
ncbi:SDR family NAD(P)-dependent oxidoreductase [Pseudomonas sp. CC120222-01a]|uniref:SDR family NAD(P)-dependent oxidoreductase n=1 Tax=Pseudomonas sp. CC120222-01a TaxID=1378075 RepID=UPI000D86982D|nr:SDR family oxidoreductase [Pseudomonas sp. CC120222-01a]PVZ42516.1 NAD(P)-dependent dehydrogenase (short-subunit alcohol dehydrogenase family) [Pseudomonas sp. CC120222-01a]